MATEPTPGERIMDAATWWTECVDSGDQAGQGDAQTALRALCARADAAEQLAVAASAYWRAIDAYDASEDSAEWEDLLEAMDRSREGLGNALAAWRAITGEVDG